jgi:hypothetical protein
MNAGKTQLMVGGKHIKDFNVTVGSKIITAENDFELLGVKFDRHFSTLPHDEMVAAATRQRASLIVRLSHHIPRENYLKQLAAGLVLGKINHALPAVNVPRLDATDGAANKSYKSVQVSLNDVARTITGKRSENTYRSATCSTWQGSRAQMP